MGGRMSHPVWVRGLKLKEPKHNREISKVAPRVGAWIETRQCLMTQIQLSRSHPVWVRGLKPFRLF